MKVKVGVGVAGQVPNETVAEVKDTWSRFGPPPMFVEVGISRMRLLPTTKGTVAVIVVQVLPFAVVAKFTVTAAEALGEIRLKSMGRMEPLSLEYRKVKVRVWAAVAFRAKVTAAKLLLFMLT